MFAFPRLEKACLLFFGTSKLLSVPFLLGVASALLALLVSLFWRKYDSAG